MKIEITVGTDGSTVDIKAIDLIGDSWRDFLDYLEKAKKAEAEDKQLDKNRAMRAAIMNMFSHLDGVVSSIHEKLVGTRTNVEGHCSLGKKMLDIKDHIYQEKKQKLPYINMKMKPLRDIIAHPSVEKVLNVSGSSVKFSEEDVFSCTTKQLDDCGKMVDAWLNKVCAIVNETRINNTSEAVREISELLGSGSVEPKEM